MRTSSLLLFNLIVFCLVQDAKAQRIPQYNYAMEVRYFNSKDYHELNFVPSMNGKKITYEVINEKKSSSKRFERSYNDQGRLLAYYKLNEEGKMPLLINQYTQDGYFKSKKRFKKGKLITEMNYEYDENDQLIDLYESKKGKEFSKKHWELNEDDCVISSTWHKRGKLRRIWTYEYYNKCDRKKSVLMNADKKILKEWNYDCKSEGEIVTPKKDVTQICKWEEADSTTIKYVSQTIDDKGRARKTVFSHRKLDTALVSIVYYDHKDRLSTESNFDPDYKNRRLSNKSYNTKGEVIWSSENIYEDDFLVKKIRKSGKWYRSIDYKYNLNQELATLDFHKKEEGNVYKKIVIDYNN